VVRSIPELSDEYEVIVTKKGDIDDITLRIEIKPGYEKKEKEILTRLQNDLRIKTNLGYNIEIHPYGSLPRYDVKARRFKDLRKHQQV
jgi:phenylacetate-CoA ligase